MQKTKSVLLAAASLALLTGVASAQNGAATRMVQVPAGAVVLVVPQAVFAPMFAEDEEPVAALPSPFAMMRQMDAMMAQARATFGGMANDGTMEAALRDGGASGVLVTSFSDGRNSCTRRVTYGAGSAAPKVEVVSATGDGCGSVGLPASVPGGRLDQPGVVAPQLQAPSRATPRTIEVKAHTPGAPFQVASAR